MRRMKSREIKDIAKKVADRWLAGYSLKNAKKIALEVRRLLLAEDTRRKEG